MPIDFPNNPSLNQTYTLNGATWRWDGAKWRLVGSITQPTVQVTSSAPSAASVGDAWVDSDDGALYVFYDNFWIAPTVNYALPTSAVNTNQIANGAVTNEKLANGPTYTSALPTSATAFNGQEIYYQASSANSIIWHLRYNSTVSRTGGTGAWEFIGGMPLMEGNNNNSTRQSSTYGDLADGDTPKITLPATGDYEISFAGALSSPAANGQSTSISPGQTTSTPSNDTDSAGIYQNDSNSWTIHVGRTIVKTGISGTWKLYYRSTNGALLYCGARWLRIIPRRIW